MGRVRVNRLVGGMSSFVITAEMEVTHSLRIERGEGRPQDADLLLSMSDNIGGKSLCALGDAAIGPVISSVKKFRDEFIYHIEHKSCLPETVRYSRLDRAVAAH